MSRVNNRLQRRVFSIRPVVNRYDPIGLSRGNLNSDECDPEITSIVRILEQATAVKEAALKAKIVFESSFQMHGALDSVDWNGLAEELWKVSRSQQW